MNDSPYDGPSWVSAVITIKARDLAYFQDYLRWVTRELMAAAEGGIETFSQCCANRSGCVCDVPVGCYHVVVTSPTKAKVDHLKRELAEAEAQLAKESGNG